MQAFYTCGMEVHFSLELQEKLNRIAAEQGRNTESLVNEAVERLIGYDEWFAREVGKGLSAGDRGEFIEHADVGKLIASRYSG